MHALATGFGLGFVVAAAIGPISLLCIRTVLRGLAGKTIGGVAMQSTSQFFPGKVPS